MTSQFCLGFWRSGPTRVLFGFSNLSTFPEIELKLKPEVVLDSDLLLWIKQVLWRPAVSVMQLEEEYWARYFGISSPCWCSA
jgi:hypothetical protein